MNEKFFSLPDEKQQSILNAAYRVFSQNSYKNSPMSEIAESAGISKALLFHYFRNKKELYLYLWDYCARTTIDYMTRYGCYEKDPEINAAIQESYHQYFSLKADKTRLNLDPGQFRPGLDVAMMYREMYWASEGYLWETVQQGEVDIARMEKDFEKLLAFWKSVYLRKEE